jgi:hypothetical protein
MSDSLRRRIRPVRLTGVLFIFPIAAGLMQFAASAQPKAARVTQVVKDVKLLRTQAAPRPATVNDEVRDGTAVRTGIDSRAELSFIDQTLARLGASTVFSFNQGARNVDLSSGAMLLYVPKNAGGTKISTAAVTAAITGTTCLAESRRNAYVKLILLEGSARVFLKRHPAQSILLHPGQMLVVKVNAATLPAPVEINLRRLRKTSRLLYPPLPSEPLMQAEEEKQLAEFPENVLVDPTSLDVIDQRINAIPTPRPRPSGAPPTRP